MDQDSNPPNSDADPRIETTRLLHGMRAGEDDARERLYQRLYGELRRLARSQIRKSSGGFQTTELVHETYLKLCQAERLSIHDRSHFFALAAQAMRQILVDHFRRTSAAKRGGDALVETIDEGLVGIGGDGSTVLAIDEALQRLEQVDERCARVVELKFFAGMKEPEIAAALDVSVRTVSGDWRKARAWLTRELA